jgi:hypothetical protein
VKAQREERKPISHTFTAPLDYILIPFLKEVKWQVEPQAFSLLFSQNSESVVPL